MTAVGGRPTFIAPPTTCSSNGFKDIKSKAFGGYHPARYHLRDLGSPRCRFRFSIPPGMCSRIEIVGSIVPATPLPHCRFDWVEHVQMAQCVPGPRGESHHVRDLRVRTGGIQWFPDEFFAHAPRFANVRKLSLFGGVDYLGSQLASHWTLPESVTSLAIKAITGVSVVAIWDIIARLPNLDDLMLWGSFIPMDRSALLGVPRGRLGGELVLCNVCGEGAEKKLLLDILTGFPFSKVEVRCAREHIPPVIRLVGACSKTIVKLSLDVIFGGKYHPFSSSG